MPLFDLTGRVAFVTGAAGGLGTGICENLHRAGAVVVCADIEEQQAAARAKEMDPAGDTTLAVPLDVRNRASVQQAADAVLERYERLDILVNNAAIYPSRPWTEIDEAEWADVVDVNLSGYFRCAQVLAPHLSATGTGRIVNLSSITFHLGFPNLLHYVSTKGAVIGLTRGLARELGPEGVTVNSIAPGAFPTDAEKIHPDPESYNAWVLEQQSIKRRGTPDDIGGLVSFLASDAAAFLSGQTIVLDGGWVMQ